MGHGVFFVRSDLEFFLIRGISFKNMKSKTIVGMFAVCGLAVSLSYGALPRQAAGRTVADGVYTEEQAGRGMQVMEDYGCRNCHGAQLEGGADEQPQLVGEEFVTSWSG